jgi:hypothetical protein
MAFYNSPFNATIVNKRYNEFKERIEGFGTYKFENGNLYKGEFKDGQ